MTTSTLKPHPVSMHVSKITSARVFDIPQLSKLPGGWDKVRLALISLPKRKLQQSSCSIIGKDQYENVDPDAHKRNLLICSEDKIQSALTTYINALKYALDEIDAKIICINELAFPSSLSGPYEKAVNSTIKTLGKRSCIIIAGSYHDQLTKYNTGRLFYPGCKETEKSFRDDDIEEAEARNTHYYHKQISAHDLKPPELINVPPRRKILLTTVFGINIAVLICRDILDYNNIANLVQARPAVDLLLVPMCTDRTDTLEELGVEISKVMAGTVAMVNYNKPGKRAFLMVCNKRQDFDYSGKIPSGGYINTYNIDPNGCEAARRRQVSRLTRRTRWLYGIQQTMRR